jgi:hypothetical protein
VAADPYVYPGIDVLCNLLDLRDAAELAERDAERALHQLY